MTELLFHKKWDFLRIPSDPDLFCPVINSYCPPDHGVLR